MRPHLKPQHALPFTAIDPTTSLIIFGPILAILILAYAAACIQYIIVKSSLWQLRREIKSATQYISTCLQRFSDKALDQVKIVDQLEAVKNKCLNQNDVVMKFREKLFIMKQENKAIRRELVILEISRRAGERSKPGGQSISYIVDLQLY
ncbi:hypothetical protein N7517_007484 [Penicillium concentricum]|uniref:Uncharacterized protein n=1 Tax=Penicillium concentricum TaxID=293559 RepID=A0A9W9SG10_9EURO|nr:uncharacterized protein N7517_007484 [Penicillium concentricum]KAJ5375478.1 hypothetical protein N7517_007484 [Penicillium concentricum]